MMRRMVVCTTILALNLLVDKFHGLPRDFRPPDLVRIESSLIRAETASQFQAMQKEMATQKLFVSPVSGFRPVSEQYYLYTSKRSVAAPPGYSEHQLGTALDLNVKFPSREWTWLDQNAHRFGFVMSYRGTQVTRTGYAFEPWHWRYVGVDLATKIRLSSALPQSNYCLF